jgi:hypothetical protein
MPATIREGVASHIRNLHLNDKADILLASYQPARLSLQLKGEDKHMKNAPIVLLTILLLLFTWSPAIAAEDDLVQSVVKGCNTELNTYCKTVTPGEGRLLACLFAHGDKLSGQCEYALYDAAVQLERAVDALAYVANECHDDLVANCSGVAAGEGRLLKCLEKNESKVSDRCKQALTDVGLK